jgi:predicted RNA-binding protein with PUA-like domain
MAYWLVKTEPSTYSFGDLLAERRTAWTGVKNPQAQLHLRAMRRGDGVAVYHTGGEKAVVGTAVVAGAPRPDPTAREGKRVAGDLEPAQPLPSPVPLATLRDARVFAGSPLLLQGRLSVVPERQPVEPIILATIEMVTAHLAKLKQ